MGGRGGGRDRGREGKRGKGGEEMGLHAARVLELHADRQVHICLLHICAIKRRRAAGGSFGCSSALRAPTCCRSPHARSGTDASPDGPSNTLGTVRTASALRSRCRSSGTGQISGTDAHASRACSASLGIHGLTFAVHLGNRKTQINI